MNNSAIFKAAHAIVKASIQNGDDYRATFGAALRMVRSVAAQTVSAFGSFRRPNPAAKASLTLRATQALCIATRHSLERNTRAVNAHNALCEAEGLASMMRVIEAK